MWAKALDLSAGKDNLGELGETFFNEYVEVSDVGVSDVYVSLFREGRECGIVTFVGVTLPYSHTISLSMSTYLSLFPTVYLYLSLSP